MSNKGYIIRGKMIIMLSMCFLLLSIAFQIQPIFEVNSLELAYSYINTKDIAKTKVAMKSNNSVNIENIFNSVDIEIPKNEENQITETTLPVNENSVAAVEQATWRLPTEMGYVTQNPSYGHVALDIGSPRGSAENIFPIANGVVTGVYRDPQGALVVTIYHNIKGQSYTSQYAHLSRFAPGLHVGQQVTVNDSIGLMGTTGNSTGVHLHIALVDCKLFDPSDTRCPGLNEYFSYARTRYNQGFVSLWSVMGVPGSWTSR